MHPAVVENPVCFQETVRCHWSFSLNSATNCRSHMEPISGTYKFGQSSLGCILIQLLNMPFVRIFFFETSQVLSIRMFVLLVKDHLAWSSSGFGWGEVGKLFDKCCWISAEKKFTNFPCSFFIQYLLISSTRSVNANRLVVCLIDGCRSSFFSNQTATN